MENVNIVKCLRFLSYLSISAVILQPFIGMNIYYVIICSMILLSIISFFYNRKIRFNKYHILLAIFVLFCIFSKLYAISQEQANYAIKELILCFLSGFCISENIFYHDNINDKRYFNKILDVFNYATCLLSIYLLLFDLPRIIGTHDRLGRLLFENYGTYMVLSYSLIISCCYGFWKLIYHNNSKIDILIFIINFITGCFSGTRKVMFCLALFVIIVIFIKNRKNGFRLIKYTLIAIICIIFVYNIITTNENLYKVIGNRVENIVQSFVFGKSIPNDASMMEREFLQLLALEAFNGHPFLGLGINNFAQYSVNHGGPFLYAHNNYYELLSDVGIIGTTIYYGAYLVILRKSFILMNNEDHMAVFIFSFLLVMLISDLQTVSYYRFHYIVMYMLFSKYLFVPKGNLSLYGKPLVIK